ncbi:hypothetical protein IWX90DRAFT_510222 [Phyllosticta citrichinensis]|uniref:F-box domain-containing protein n=1 Tax=Phyllosticta citrichinensis TaxID=1130410 RepID=A0ABR1Y699_9PEZI
MAPYSTRQSGQVEHKRQAQQVYNSVIGAHLLNEIHLAEDTVESEMRQFSGLFEAAHMTCPRATINTLPMDLLLEVVDLVGTMDPVTLSPKFHDIQTDWSKRSLAIKSREENPPRSLAFDSHEFKDSPYFAPFVSLQKLSIVLPESAQLKDFRKSFYGLPQLPSVRSLVIDPASRFMIRCCPNVSSILLVGFVTNGPGFGILLQVLDFVAGLKGLRHLEIDTSCDFMLDDFMAMRNIESLTLVGQVHGRNRLDLYFMHSRLGELMPNLKSLTLVVAGKPNDGSLAAEIFRAKKYTIATAQSFFLHQANLKEFGLACASEDFERGDCSFVRWTRST